MSHRGRSDTCQNDPKRKDYLLAPKTSDSNTYHAKVEKCAIRRLEHQP